MQSVKSLDDLVLDLQRHVLDGAAYAAFRSAAERAARDGGPKETFLDVLASLCQAAPPEAGKTGRLPKKALIAM